MTNVVPQTSDVVSTIREQHAQVRQLIGTIKAAAPDQRAQPFGQLASMPRKQHGDAAHAHTPHGGHHAPVHSVELDPTEVLV